VVIRYLYVEGITVTPHEANAELIVNSNAVLARSVIAQVLEPVAGRNSQILQPPGGMEHGQFFLSGAPQVCRGHSLALACVPEFLRTLVREGLDHRI
jgi:hypothetical protein